MAKAVYLLSPVTILTVTPASWHLLTASGIYYLIGSLIPTIANPIKPWGLSENVGSTWFIVSWISIS